MLRDRSRALIIDGMDTYKDWGLILSEQSASPPEPKTYFVDVPSGDGSIDLTEALSGGVTYSDRKESYTFLYDGSNNRGNTFEELKSEIQNRIHGRRFEYKKTFDDEYTYTGRMSVSDVTNEGRIHFIKLDIDANPYKTKGLQTDWYNITDGAQIGINSGRKRVRPKFEFNTSTLVCWDGKSYVMPQGTYTMDDVVFTEGANFLTLVPMAIRKYLTYKELSKYSYGHIGSQKRIYEWFRAESKYMVSKLVITGTVGIEITGDVIITATSESGETEVSTLSLGSIVITAIDSGAGGILEDEICVKNDGNSDSNNSYVRKWISGTAEDESTYYYPMNTGISCYLPFFNDSPIASVTVTNNGVPVAFEYETINTEETQTHGEVSCHQATFGEYEQGRDYEMTYGEMKTRRVSSLMSWIESTTSTTTDYDVIADDSAKYQVWIEHEWSDL